MNMHSFMNDLNKMLGTPNNNQNCEILDFHFCIVWYVKISSWDYVIFISILYDIVSIFLQYNFFLPYFCMRNAI